MFPPHTPPLPSELKMQTERTFFIALVLNPYYKEVVVTPAVIYKTSNKVNMLVNKHALDDRALL